MQGDIGERPSWDHEAAERLLGKTVIVGLTYLDQDENVLDQVQRHGTIVRADEVEGFGIDTGEADLFWLPPHLEAFEPAPPGEYRLRSTGEVIVDPDLTSTWTIHAPESGESSSEVLDTGYEAS